MAYGGLTTSYTNTSVVYVQAEYILVAGSQLQCHHEPYVSPQMRRACKNWVPRPGHEHRKRGSVLQRLMMAYGRLINNTRREVRANGPQVSVRARAACVCDSVCVCVCVCTRGVHARGCACVCARICAMNYGILRP